MDTASGQCCNSDLKEYAGYHGHYIKYSMRNAMDIATLSCSVVSKIDTAKNILESTHYLQCLAPASSVQMCGDGRKAERQDFG